MRSQWAVGFYVFAAVALGQTPTFEAASVKAVVSDNRARAVMRGGPGTPDAGQITYTNATLMSVLMRAFDVKNFQISGPDWLTSRRYDILARVPAGATRERFNQMLQNLLAERFRLVVHHETRPIQGFDLVTGRGAVKLKPSTESPEPGAEPTGPPKTDSNGFPILDKPGLALMEGVKGKSVITFLTARAQPISALVDMLSREFRLPIADKTGLTGKFDFRLEFAPQPPGALPPPPSADALPEIDDSAPNLTTAVQQQLGLRLNPARIPLDVVVIDRGDPTPIEN